MKTSADNCILTLQFGDYANHVGTHIWNSQDWYNYSLVDDDVNLNVFFREGLNAWNDRTFTPRLFLCDLKGNFGSMPEYSPLYAGDLAYESKLEWPGKKQVVEKSTDQISKYHLHLNKEDTTLSSFPREEWKLLDEEIKSWSDYSRLFYHSKSTHAIYPTSIEDGGILDTFNLGYSLTQDSSWLDSVMDEKIRFFIEECDNIDGFNVHVDTYNGFGGIAVGTLDAIRDEFPKGNIVTFGYQDFIPSTNDSSDRELHKWRINSSLASNRLFELSSLFVPIQISSLAQTASHGWSKYLHYNPHSKYHSSAIISSAIDSILHPCRSSMKSLSEIVSMITYDSLSRIAHVSAVLPMKLYRNDIETHLDFMSRMMKMKKSFTLLGKSDKKEIIFSQYNIYRGIDQHRGCSSLSPETPVNEGLAKEVIEHLSTTATAKGNFSECIITESGFPYYVPYPCMIKKTFGIDDLSPQEDLNYNNENEVYTEEEQVPMAASLYSTNRTGEYLEYMVDSIGPMRGNNCFESFKRGPIPLAEEDFLSCREDLLGELDKYSSD